MTAMTPHRLMVVANRTCPCPGLVDEIRRLAAGDAEVLVVSPALNGRVRHWVSDVDGAVAAAQDRLAVALALLAEAGIEAAGEIGDSDPLVAVADAMTHFPADALLVSTHPAPHSNWLERDLIPRAEDRFGVPVAHLVSEYGLVPA